MYILNFIHSYKVKTDNKYMIFCSICDKRKTKTNSDKFGLCNKCSLPVCGDTNCGSDLRAFSPSGTVVHECMSCILNKIENLTEESTSDDRSKNSDNQDAGPSNTITDNVQMQTDQKICGSCQQVFTSGITVDKTFLCIDCHDKKDKELHDSTPRKSSTTQSPRKRRKKIITPQSSKSTGRRKK